MAEKRKYLNLSPVKTVGENKGRTLDKTLKRNLCRRPSQYNIAAVIVAARDVSFEERTCWLASLISDSVSIQEVRTSYFRYFTTQ